MSVLLELSINPLFEAIKPQPDDQRQFLVLPGYISATTEEKVTVYPELDLRSYLEIPRGEIIWAEKAIPGQESSPTKLVINATAKVTRVTTARQVEVGFLSGMIASTCLPSSAAGVTFSVSVGKGAPTPTEPCPQSPGHAIPKGTGGSSNCKVTGVCKTDGISL